MRFGRPTHKPSSKYRELTTLDIDGNVLREIDDVVLLADVETDTHEEGAQFFRGTIPSGSVGTITVLAPSGDLSVDLEFSLAGKMAFAHARPRNLRLHRGREEKLPNA